MKVVLATTNKNKVKRLKNLLKDLDIELVSLDEINLNIKEPDETADTCGGIAAQKASHYVTYLPKDTLVLTQDDTLSLEGVEECDDPKNHIKEPVVNKYGEFTDEFAIEYYVDLVNKYGGSIPISFHYGHAVAISTNDRNYTKVISSESKLNGRLINEVKDLDKCKGYFLGAILQICINGEWKYWNDLTDDELVIADHDLYLSISKLLKDI